MTKKSPRKSKQKLPVSKLKQLVARPQFLPLLIIVILALAGLVAIASVKLRPDPFAGSRQAADAFMQAYVNCDFKTAQKYYLVFQVNEDKANEYKQSCVKGAITYSFYKNDNGAVEKKNGLVIKNIGYIYKVTQKGVYNGNLLIYMEWLGDDQKWGVFSATPTTLSQSNLGQ